MLFGTNVMDLVDMQQLWQDTATLQTNARQSSARWQASMGRLSHQARIGASGMSQSVECNVSEAIIEM